MKSNRLLFSYKKLMTLFHLLKSTNFIWIWKQERLWHWNNLIEAGVGSEGSTAAPWYFCSYVFSLQLHFLYESLSFLLIKRHPYKSRRCSNPPSVQIEQAQPLSKVQSLTRTSYFPPDLVNRDLKPPPWHARRLQIITLELLVKYRLVLEQIPPYLLASSIIEAIIKEKGREFSTMFTEVHLNLCKLGRTNGGM